MTEQILKQMSGIFDGKNMVVSDNCSIQVPANYASKSMLLAGTGLTYYITNERSYFKQTKLTPGVTALATIIDDLGDLRAEALVEGYPVRFKFLYAFTTFYKLKPGDEVVIVYPEFTDFEERYCVIENVIS